MNSVRTAYFGDLQYGDDSVYHFPSGLPGFEGCKSFVLIQRPDMYPLTFLQSIGRPGVCFVGMPARGIREDYDLRLSGQERAELGFAPIEEPRIGPDILCLALISFQEDGSATANLRAPVVINVRSKRGTQPIQDYEEYSLRHPVAAWSMESKCS